MRELPIFAKTLKIVGFFPISKQTPYPYIEDKIFLPKDQQVQRAAAKHG
jgi:hypothetical protein